MTDRRSLIALSLASLAACILMACAARALGEEAGADLVAAELAEPEAPAVRPGIADDIATWWRTGALAAPVAAAVFALLVILERLSLTRWPGLGWLRRGSTRSWISLAIGNLTVMLPAVATGTVTSGGVAVALLGGLIAFRPGGGERKPDEQGDEAPT